MDHEQVLLFENHNPTDLRSLMNTYLYAVSQEPSFFRYFILFLAVISTSLGGLVLGGIPWRMARDTALYALVAAIPLTIGVTIVALAQHAELLPSSDPFSSYAIFLSGCFMAFFLMGRAAASLLYLDN